METMMKAAIGILIFAGAALAEAAPSLVGPTPYFY
jgi:hypothetical protein